MPGSKNAPIPPERNKRKKKKSKILSQLTPIFGHVCLHKAALLFPQQAWSPSQHAARV